jgi:membrane protein YdbS with pleckstrin-like domain
MHDVSPKARAMNRVRILITLFIVVLLATVSLGWVWTGNHQPPRLRAASHTVLGIAALAGVFALGKIWRSDTPAPSVRRGQS